MKLRVGTYNIQHGALFAHRIRYNEEIIDLSMMAAQVKAMNLDFCSLNEVRNHENLEGGVNQAKEIGEMIKYDWRFARAIDFRGGYYGNAIVSRLPIISCKSIPITTDPLTRPSGSYYEDRVLMVTEVEIGEGKTLTVLSTHFGLNDIEQDKAIEVIENELKNITTPVLLTGDFNLTPDTDRYKKLSSMLHDASDSFGMLPTFNSIIPDIKIDYIFVSDDIKVENVTVPEICVSDHRPIYADIEI